MRLYVPLRVCFCLSLSNVSMLIAVPQGNLTEKMMSHFILPIIISKKCLWIINDPKTNRTCSHRGKSSGILRRMQTHSWKFLKPSKALIQRSWEKEWFRWQRQNINNNKSVLEIYHSELNSLVFCSQSAPEKNVWSMKKSYCKFLLICRRELQRKGRTKKNSKGA